MTSEDRRGLSFGYLQRPIRRVSRVAGRQANLWPLPALMRPVYVLAIGLAEFIKRFFVTLLACFLRSLTLRNPLVPLLNWATESESRGMHGWYDLVDWVGGWPFEVARPEEVFRFVRDRGFRLEVLPTSVGHECNEFVFVRVGAAPAPSLHQN